LKADSQTVNSELAGKVSQQTFDNEVNVLNNKLAAKLAYPSGGSDGDLLAKDGTAAEWVAAPEAGLTLIASESFTTVSSVSLNGCFTSDYENYRIMFVPSTTTNARLRLRYRASGSDNTTSNYAWTDGFSQNGGTVGGGNSSNSDTAARLFYIGNSMPGALSADIFSPNASLNTSGVSHGTYRQSEPLMSYVLAGHIFLATTSFDGFTLYPESSTMSGTVRVYGYKD